MNKIDNTTYKAIKRSEKEKKRSRNSSIYSKGRHGHSRHYKNMKIIMTLVIFLIILADVTFSLIVFQTRKTVFVILACVLSIPFARNIIDLFMALKAKPLSKEQHEETERIASDIKRSFLYDISITDTEGLVYIPCLLVYNNNIIAYTPEVTEVKKREEIKKYLGAVNASDEHNYRISVTDKLSSYEKEVRRVKDRNSESEAEDAEVTELNLTMGI